MMRREVIGICTDSNSQLPAELASRFGVEIVPLTVVVDRREYLEGFDLDVDEFYGLYADAHRPSVEFSQPSPGQFAVAYDELVARGCTQILSIHTSAAVSGTLRAARLAAHSAPVPVRLVDSRTARFGVSCCVWATADAIAAGATLEEAALVAEHLAPSIRNVFIVSGLDLIAHERVLTPSVAATNGMPGTIDGVCALRTRKVMTLVDDHVCVVREVDSLVGAVNAMAAYTLTRSSRAAINGLNVAVGSAHQSMLPVAEALTTAVSSCSHVREVVQFRIGPSVGVETGPGTVGCVMYPA